MYQEFSHIVPSLRLVSVTGALANVAIPVPGASNGDVLLGAIVPTASDLSLLQDAVFEDGSVTFETISTAAVVVTILYFDADAVLE